MRVCIIPAMRYRKGMAEVKKLDFNNPPPILDEEDEETLAAIDEGIRDADAGRTVSIEEVRDLVPKWITESSSRDNSANNPLNPDPTATVRWGDQSWDEMLVPFVGVLVESNADPSKVLRRAPGPAVNAVP